MNKRPTRSELAKQRSKDVFAGRRQALDSFRRNLELRPESEDRKFIWMVCGEGGIGKSTLLRRYRSILSEMEYRSAWIDEFTPATVLSVMHAIAEELEKQGAPLKAFAERYKTYRQRKNEIDADPDRPKGFAAAIGKAGGRIGVEVIKQVPLAGGLTTALIGEEFIVEKTSEFADYVARKLGSKDDARLVLEPLDALTPLFVEGLSAAAERKPIALFIDTYEKTGEYLDAWLRDILEGKYGELSLDVLIVMAGRNDLGQAWLSEMIEPFLEVISLEPFTEEEAREYLTRQGITQEKAIEIILTLSGRVPVLLTTLASSIPDDPSKLGDPTGEAIERFLKWVAEEAQRQAVLTCALPRMLNLDVAAVLLGDEQAEVMFNFVRGMSFVSQRAGGWVYHDVVRLLMLRQRRQESRRRWQEMHTRLADYYAAERDALQLSLKDGQRDARWQQFNLEWLYHTICAKGRGAIDTWLMCIINTFKSGSPAEYDKAVGETIRAAGGALEEADIAAWGQKVVLGMESLNSKDYTEALPMLDAVIASTRTFSPKEQATAHYKRGYVHYYRKNYSAALADFSRAIELQPNRGSNYHWRGRMHYQMQNYSAALADLNRAIALKPNDGDNYRWRGATHYQMQNYSAALADFRRVVELLPDNGYNYHWRGRTHYEMQEYAAALTDFSRAVELLPHDGYNYHWRGRAYHELREYKEALADFSYAVELLPNEGYIYNWRGTTHYELHDYAVALVDLNRAVELQPEDGNNHYWRGRIYYEVQAYTAALADFTHAVELQPEDSYNYFWRGLTHYRLKNYTFALADFTRAVELQPDTEWNHYWNALTKLHLHDFAGALLHTNRAIELAPKQAHNRFWRAVVQRALAESDDDDLTQAEALTQEASDACLKARLLARCALLRGDVVTACKHYTQALAADCDSDARRNEQGHLRLLAELFSDRDDIREVAAWFDGQIAARAE